jgi:hypothetical protein
MTIDYKFIREWNSIKECGETLKINRGHISSVCSGRLKSIGGFKFKLKN